MLLASLQLYTTPIIRGVAIIELLLFVVLFRHSLISPIRPFAFLEKAYTDCKTTETPILNALIALLLIALCFNWLSSLGQVFGYWDPTASYNRWAVDFAQNHLPTLTWHYPQLLPANWSLSYVLIGPLPNAVHLEMFPAAIQGLFFLGLLFLVLSCNKLQDVGFKWALVILAVLMPLKFWVYLNTRYADFAVAFFNFFAICLIILKPKHWRSLSLILALAAAMTKPAGIYSVIAIPLLQALSADSTSANKYGPLFSKWLILFALTALWYVYIA